MEIRRVKVKIMRDQLCQVSRDVGEHEVAVLQAVHGDASVEVVGDADSTMSVEDVGTEYLRLVSRYGVDNERKQSFAEIAYGRGPNQLAAALRSAEVVVKRSAPPSRKSAPPASGSGGQGGSAREAG